MMPLKMEKDYLQAELGTISRIIADCEKYGDLMGKMQFEHRKSQIESHLSSMQNTKVAEKAKVALFFAGHPVLGARAINADFAGNVISEFQHIISKVFANSELGQVGSRGNVALLGKSQMMITSIAKGSFGFVLEEMNEQEDLAQETELKTVVNHVVSIIDRVASNNSLDFENVLPEIDHRTLLSLKDFFVELDKNQATVRLVDSDQEICLDGIAVHRARERIENTKIEEENHLIEGILQGFLPDHKQFELKLSDFETIHGKTTKEFAEEYHKKISEGIAVINQKWKMEAAIRTVKPINGSEKIIHKLLRFST